MRTWRLLALLCCGVLVAGAAACGGDDGDDGESLRPQLAGTPLPTATPAPPTPVICDVQTPIAPPASYPEGIAVPEGFVLFGFETVPHLAFAGRVHLPPGDDPDDPIAGLDPLARMERQILEAMRDTWAFELNARSAGRDYVFTAPDGRAGRLNIQDTMGCPEYVDVIFELPWITPGG